MFVNPYTTNVVTTAHTDSEWYEEIEMIDPARTNSDSPRANISVVHELCQGLFSSLKLCIRLLQRLVAPVQQWDSTARP
jgi:hypothetical protein